MSEAANVRAIQVLTDLRNALSRFASGAQSALTVADAEIQRTQEWLRQREAHWQREVEKARRAVERAQAALSRCLSSGYRDRDGHYHPPNCSAELRALAEAQRWLQEVEAEQQKVKYWQAQVEKAAQSYRVQARRMRDLTGSQAERARALLDRKRADLEKYQAVALTGAASALLSATAQRILRDYQRLVSQVGRKYARVGDPRARGTKQHTYVEQNVSRRHAQPEVFARKYGRTTIVTDARDKGSIGADLLVTKSGKYCKPGDVLPRRDVEAVLDAKFGRNTISSARARTFERVFGKAPIIVRPEGG